MRNSDLNHHQTSIFGDRYQQTPDETVEGMFRRCAEAAAKNEPVLGMSREEQITQFENLMLNDEGTLAGRGLANLGPNGNQMIFNCTAVQILDSRKSITTTLADFTEIAALGGGIGTSYSHLRPKGDPTKKSRGVASGPCSFIDVFQSMGGTIKQNGTRGLATMTSLAIDHPDIVDFILSKVEDGRWPTTNISVEISDKFMEAVRDGKNFDLVWDGEVRETVSAQNLWDMICKYAHHNGEPGVLFIDTMNRNTPYAGYLLIETTNPCVSGDTPMLTDTGFKQIQDCVGKTVSAWNGFEYSEVTPEITGYNQKLLKVSFSDGSSLKCTPYHGFYLKGKKGKVKTQDLKIGDKLDRFSFPVIQGFKEIAEKEAYTRGFFCGDGSIAIDRDRYSIYLYDKKIPLVPYLQALKDWDCSGRTCVELDRNMNWDKTWVPGPEYTINTRLNWLAGLLDSDGGSCGNGAYNIPSVNRNFLFTVKEMLHTLGISSTVSLMKKAETKLMPDGNEGQKEYQCQGCWRIVISGSAIAELVKLGLITHRIDTSYTPTRNAQRFIQVVNIEDAGIADKVYCYNEPKRHRGLFGCVSTGQCGEQPLPPNTACNLGSVNVAKFIDLATRRIDYSGIKQAAFTLTLMLNNLIDIAKYPTQAFEETIKKFRPVGVGIMGFADLLLYAGVPYGANPEALKIAEKVAQAVYNGAKEASEALAEQFGPFPGYDSQISSFPPRRNITLTSYAPTGTISAFFDVSSGIEPHFAPTTVRREELGTNTVRTTALDRYMNFHNLTEIPEHARFSISGPEGSELSVRDHLEILRVFSHNCDSAVSKTINLPEDATEKNVSDVFMYCWENGIKGCTVYRNGSRKNAPIQAESEDIDEDDNDDFDEDDLVEVVEITPKPRSRPKVLEGRTVPIKPDPNGPTIWITINNYEDAPFEIFFNTRNATHQEFLNALGRAITTLWRAGFDINHLLKDFCQYESPTGGNFCEYAPGKHKRFKSILDGIGTVIQEHIRVTVDEGESNPRIREEEVEHEEVESDVGYTDCPDCGMHTYRQGAGCPVCENCGYSKCG